MTKKEQEKKEKMVRIQLQIGTISLFGEIEKIEIEDDVIDKFISELNKLMPEAEKNMKKITKQLKGDN